MSIEASIHHGLKVSTLTRRWATQFSKTSEVPAEFWRRCKHFF